MSKKNIRTSVDLTEFVQPIKERLTPIYGLKGILSAGILVFSKLPAEDREKAITEANGIAINEVPEPSPRKSLQDTIQMIKEIVEVEKQQPGTIYRVLSHDEQKIIDEFRKLITPKTQKQIKKAKGG